MKDYIKIENNNNLVRDPITGAIINRNEGEYHNYLKNYERLKREKEEMENLKETVSSLNTEISEIKNLLNVLIGRLKYDN